MIVITPIIRSSIMKQSLMIHHQALDNIRELQGQLGQWATQTDYTTGSLSFFQTLKHCSLSTNCTNEQHKLFLAFDALYNF